MPGPFGLERERDYFTTLDLLNKFAAHKDLEIPEGTQRAWSRVIKSYTLSQTLLRRLADRGIEPDTGTGHKPTLLSLYVGLHINKAERGIQYVAETGGFAGLTSPGLTSNKLFVTLVELDPEAPAIAKELAESGGVLVVRWAELGLGGIRRVSDLFEEFVGKNEAKRQLGLNAKVFNPNPYERLQVPGDELWFTEPVQPRIFQAWRDQLEEYKRSL